eukprot:TRINITY_DN92083_c0_g1_i1.p1 TRINITY_DN92083_c0_g1~~TRINITY_DN92083_c0_g1_i1.p1  ORF type:complete len:108 (+),score=10.93 TRINITY_DN92083_c0_g1_i1:46-324(+)
MNSSATGDGGGIYAFSSSVNINTTDFTNMKSANGGAICLQGKSSITVQGGNFISNMATLGGAINADSSTKLTKIGRAVQQECRDRSRMPSSA